MIGSALIKLAKEKEMEVTPSVAYGSLDGFAATMFEGSGYKVIVFSSWIDDAEMKNQFLARLEGTELKKEYRVIQWNVTMKYIRFVFHDTIGTMKYIRSFLEWIVPILREYQATAWNVCSKCGGQVTVGKWIMVNGAASFVHEQCADQIRESIAEENIQRKEERTGSYATGAMGAFLGAVLGAALWAAILMAGYIASIVGLAIGFFAKFGYNLCHGRKGKGMIVILILAVIFGVLLGTISAEVLAVAEMISNGELYGYTYADIPWLISAVLQADAEYRSALLGQILTGLLFAGLGVFALLRNAGREIADVKFKELS